MNDCDLERLLKRLESEEFSDRLAGERAGFSEADLWAVNFASGNHLQLTSHSSIPENGTDIHKFLIREYRDKGFSGAWWQSILKENRVDDEAEFAIGFSFGFRERVIAIWTALRDKLPRAPS
jgi:hypothetical protein